MALLSTYKVTLTGLAAGLGMESIPSYQVRFTPDENEFHRLWVPRSN